MKRSNPSAGYDPEHSFEELSIFGSMNKGETDLWCRTDPVGFESTGPDATKERPDRLRACPVCHPGIAPGPLDPQTPTLRSSIPPSPGPARSSNVGRSALPTERCRKRIRCRPSPSDATEHGLRILAQVALRIDDEHGHSVRSYLLEQRLRETSLALSGLAKDPQVRAVPVLVQDPLRRLTCFIKYPDFSKSETNGPQPSQPRHRAKLAVLCVQLSVYVYVA